MKSKIEEILDRLLKDIKKGKSVEDCLKEYPQNYDELKSLLKLAIKIEELPKPELNPEAFAKTLSELEEMLIDKKCKEKKFSFRKIYNLHPVMIRSIVVILFIVFLISTSFTFSVNSLPGDFLYPVKLLRERAKYILTFDNEGKAELHLLFADKRTKELSLSFREGAEINRELLSNMLIETQSALKYAEILPLIKAIQLINNIGECNKYQKKILEDIKPFATSSDTSIINEAINLCAQRHYCIHCKLYYKSINQLPTFPCWDKNYNCE